MTFDDLRKVWDCECENPTEKFVLWAFATYANKEMKCWPSIAEVGRRTGLSTRIIRKHLANLNRRGVLVIEQAGGGRHHVNNYRIKLGNPERQSVNDNHCIPFTESKSRNPEPRSTNPEPRSAQLPVTAVELPKERGRPHRKFVSELEAQIKAAREAMAELRNRGTNGEGKWDDLGDLEEYRRLKGKCEEWRKEMLRQ